MLSWLPLLGPIFQGIASIVTPFFKTEAVKAKADAEVTIAETQTSASIIQTTNDDIALRIMRDAAILPVVVWSMIIGWDNIIVRHYPHLYFSVETYPQSVSYLPYVVLVFLFGNIGMNIWSKK